MVKDHHVLSIKSVAIQSHSLSWVHLLYASIACSGFWLYISFIVPNILTADLKLVMKEIWGGDRWVFVFFFLGGGAGGRGKGVFFGKRLLQIELWPLKLAHSFFPNFTETGFSVLARKSTSQNSRT